MTPEHAIAIARVSSLKQREEDQRPGLQAYADRKGYILDEMVPINGRSAFHGRHIKEVLAAVEKHVRHGLATVVIFRHVDRSSRQGVFEGFDLLKKIMDAGARVEFSEQEYLSVQPGMIGLFFDLAQKESEIKRDRKIQGNTRKRAGGELVGSVPWGYEPVLRGDVRVGIQPNALGREWIPRIFQAAVSGKNIRAISDMLRGVPSPKTNELWDMTTLARLIKNKTYCGSMRGNPNMKFEALVSVELHKSANLAVAARDKGGRGVREGTEPRFLYPVCGECLGQKREGAPSGRSPMYVSKATKRGRVYRYYYCNGHGPVRNGCGAPVIPVEKLDAAVDAEMATNTRRHKTLAFVAGDDSSEQRALLLDKARVAMDAGDLELSVALTQEAMKIGPSERKATVTEVDSGMTVGKHWETLTRAEKREELRQNWTVVVYLDHVDTIGPWREPGSNTIIGDMIADTP